jgi:Cys-tRNA(Pro)/Cys-tRNA(Cys) deacylase
MTGYIRGGVTVLGAKKEYPVYVDETALGFDAISVSAGVRGTQIVLAGADYARAVQAVAGPLAK